MMEKLEKMAPFIRRARVAVNGREKLQHLQKRLAFLIFATDLSANSRREMEGHFQCPIYTCLTGADISRLFVMPNTKIVGILKGPLAEAIEPELAAASLSPESK